jgi:hypothetical protein
MFPSVAVKDVDAVNEPVMAVFPVAFPILVGPVPPVPIDVTPAPVVFIFVVPVIAAPPNVTVRPVAAVIVVVEAIDPGAINVVGVDRVTIPAVVAAVI